MTLRAVNSCLEPWCDKQFLMLYLQIVLSSLYTLLTGFLAKKDVMITHTQMYIEGKRDRERTMR